MYFPGVEAFLAIVRTESISKAAEFLHLSQATVSYRLKTLEQEMGGLVAFVVREIVSPSVTVKPFFSEEMVLLRLAGPGRQAGDTVEMGELAAEHEVFINWNREFQFRHDQWWDPLCPSRVHLDTAGLIATFLKDARQWTIVPASIGAHMMRIGDFVLQKLSAPVPPRICYKVTHKFPNQALHDTLCILDNYLQDIFGI